MKPNFRIIVLLVLCAAVQVVLLFRYASLAQQQQRNFDRLYEQFTVLKNANDQLQWAFDTMQQANNKNHAAAVTCTQSLDKLEHAIMGAKK